MWPGPWPGLAWPWAITASGRFRGLGFLTPGLRPKGLGYFKYSLLFRILICFFFKNMTGYARAPRSGIFARCKRRLGLTMPSPIHMAWSGFRFAWRNLTTVFRPIEGTPREEPPQVPEPAHVDQRAPLAASRTGCPTSSRATSRHRSTP